MGDDSDRDLVLAQAHAVDLEWRGDWEGTATVFEKLAVQLPDSQESEFAASGANRLRDRTRLSEEA
jgi:hypothetical protein